MTVWWKTSDRAVHQRLYSFAFTGYDTDGAAIARFRRLDHALVSLTMKDLGELAASHRQRLAHPLTLRSDKTWLRRELELSLLGATRLNRDLGIKLHAEFLPKITAVDANLVLEGESAAQYKALMQRLTSPRYPS